MQQHLMMGKTAACPELEGTLWTWGENSSGFLGHDDTTKRSSPTQVGSGTNWTNKVSPNGTAAIMLIKSDGTLWAWGTNNFGQSGLGDTTARSSPVQVGSDTDWAFCTTTGSSAYAIKTDGTLYSCGYNNYGQLGHNDATDRSTLAQVGSLTDWASVSSFPWQHVLFLKTDGTLWGVGYNNVGQLGNGASGEIQSSPVQVGSETHWIAFDAGAEASRALASV